MIESGRQVGNLAARSRDLSLPRFIGEAHQRIGIGDIQIIADQRHAERRVKAFKEGGLQIGYAIPVGIAQQSDAVSTVHAGTGAGHDDVANPAFQIEA